MIQCVIITIMGSTLPCCKEKDQPIEVQITPPSSATELPPPHTPFSLIQSEETPVSNKNIRSIVESSPKRHKEGRSPQNYQSVKILGKGSFGYVVLVEQKTTGKRFAMKMIPKSKINQQNLLQTKVIPSIRKHSFLTNIHETFQNKDNIYIVMEYLPKGDLYFYANKQGAILSQTVIRDVLAEIIIGIQYLHKHGIVYRELKPENILVTDQGHIKLTDYGLSKLILENNSHKGISTFIGAVEYMAPEAISGHFDQKADLWALGIVTFQLKFKENPIESDGHINQTIAEYEALINKNYLQEKINSKIGYMSHQFRELLLKLLEKSPERRISLQQLKLLPFFQGVNWQQVQERKNIGPLAEVIRTNDLIKFRDPTSEQTKRRQVFKRHPGGNNQNFSINLLEVRISQ